MKTEVVAAAFLGGIKKQRTPASISMQGGIPLADSRGADRKVSVQIRYAKQAEWNPLPTPKLSVEDSVSIAKVMATQAVWMPRSFVTFVKALNKAERDDLILLHPHRLTNAEWLEQFFDDDLAIGFPFARRVIAGEKTNSDWLHRMRSDTGEILDDNRIPKKLWSFAYCGYPLRPSKTSAWNTHGFRDYEVTHILPHKTQQGDKPVFTEVFEDFDGFNVKLLFLSCWNILLVNKQVAGATDNSPIITALLLHEAKRRYSLNLDKIGKLKNVVQGIDIVALHGQLSWPPEDPENFVPLYQTQDRFSVSRKQMLKKIIELRQYRPKQPKEEKKGEEPKPKAPAARRLKPA